MSHTTTQQGTAAQDTFNVSRPAPGGLMTLDQLLDTEPPVWTIPGILPSQGYGLIFGREGSGKTQVILSPLFSIAMGRPIFGNPTQQGITVLVSGEGNSGLANRARAWLAANDVKNTEATLVCFYTEPFNILDDRQVNRLIHTLRQFAGEIPIRCVVFDTYNRALGGAGDENSARDTSAAVNNFDRIARQLQCLSIASHHEPKSTGQVEQPPTPRGSNVLTANADTVLHVTRSRDEIEVTLTKQKDAQTDRSFRFTQHVIDLNIKDSAGHPQTSVVAIYEGENDACEKVSRPTLSKTQKLLLRLLQDHDEGAGLHEDDWYEAAHAKNVVGGAKPRRTFKNALGALLDRQLVAANDNGAYTTVTAAAHQKD